MATKQDNEKELIDLAKQGNIAALGELCEFHRYWLDAQFKFRWNLPNEAEDLVQDVFVEVVKRIRTFKGETAFSTWLFYIAKGIVFRFLSKLSVPTAARASGEIMTARGVTRRAETLSLEGLEVDFPEDSIVGRTTMQEAFYRLKSNLEREAAIACHIHGYTAQEYANRIGTSKSAIVGRLKKAGDHLTEILGAPHISRQGRRIN